MENYSHNRDDGLSVLGSTNKFDESVKTSNKILFQNPNLHVWHWPKDALLGVWKHDIMSSYTFHINLFDFHYSADGSLAFPNCEGFHQIFGNML